MTWGGQESLILGKDSVSGGDGGCETPSRYSQTPEKLGSGELCAHRALLGASLSCQRGGSGHLEQSLPGTKSLRWGALLCTPSCTTVPPWQRCIWRNTLRFSLAFCKLLLNWVMAAASPRRGWLGRCSPRAAFAAAGGSRAGLPMAVRLSVWINGEKIQAV